MRRNHPKSCYQKQRNIRQEHGCFKERSSPKVLMLASVASMIDQFNMSNIMLLQDMGYEVHVACNFKHGNTCDGVQIKKMYETLQNMHVICHAWDCPRKLCRMKQCMNAYLQLWELTGANSFAWIHCHSPIGAALARIIAHRRKIRVIYTAHGFHFYKGAPLKNCFRIGQTLSLQSIGKISILLCIISMQDESAIFQVSESIPESIAKIGKMRKIRQMHLKKINFTENIEYLKMHLCCCQSGS